MSIAWLARRTRAGWSATTSRRRSRAAARFPGVRDRKAAHGLGLRRARRRGEIRRDAADGGPRREGRDPNRVRAQRRLDESPYPPSRTAENELRSGARGEGKPEKACVDRPCRASRGVLARRKRLRLERDRHSDQLRPVHERLEPAPHPARARLVRLGRHRRRDVPDRPVLRRRLERHRLSRRRRTRGGRGRPGCSRDTVSRAARDARSATRPSPTTRCHNVWMISTLAHRLERRGRGDPDEPLHRRRPHLGHRSRRRPRAGPSTTRTGSPATRGRRARTTATATRSGTSATLYMSTSTDGGLTWGPKKTPSTSGIGGQPVVQPNGTVVVAYEGGAESARSARPTAGTPGFHRSRSPRSASTASRGTSARRHCPRRRSPGTARSTSRGRTAASAAGAARTTSSTARRWTALRGRPRFAFRSTRRIAESITSSPASRSTARPRAPARGSRSVTTTTPSRTAPRPLAS